VGVEATQPLFPQQEDSMKILAIDLGKFNSVACSFNTKTNQSVFETIATQQWAWEQLLN
jgi:transposase